MKLHAAGVSKPSKRSERNIHLAEKNEWAKQHREKYVNQLSKYVFILLKLEAFFYTTIEVFRAYNNSDMTGQIRQFFAGQKLKSIF
jgi:cob(I)alamin adenosyltransferase